jgi:hypothetical protein
MLPSPSLGPPWLSLSASPAFGPWGIPEELDVPELEPELVDVAAGAEDELDELEFDEPPPHPATVIAPSVSINAAHRRIDIHFVFIDLPLFAFNNRRYGLT